MSHSARGDEVILSIASTRFFRSVRSSMRAIIDVGARSHGVTLRASTMDSIEGLERYGTEWSMQTANVQIKSSTV